MSQDIFYTMNHSKRVLARVYFKQYLAIQSMARFLADHRFGKKRYKHLRILAQLHLQISQDLEEEYTIDMIKLLQSSNDKKE
jgi:hypothetical protein